jgi:hypothetical protein
MIGRKKRTLPQERPFHRNILVSSISARFHAFHVALTPVEACRFPPEPFHFLSRRNYTIKKQQKYEDYPSIVKINSLFEWDKKEAAITIFSR